jgi:hypothetical protein
MGWEEYWNRSRGSPDCRSNPERRAGTARRASARTARVNPLTPTFSVFSPCRPLNYTTDAPGTISLLRVLPTTGPTFQMSTDIDLPHQHIPNRASRWTPPTAITGQDCMAENFPLDPSGFCSGLPDDEGCVSGGLFHAHAIA